MILTTDAYVIELVRNYPRLFLTGSHAFGYVSLGSDWDFFTSDTMICNNSDFILAIDSKYDDSNCISVWRDKTHQVHIQIVKDVQKKIRAQNLLLSMPIVIQYTFLKLDKPARREVWEWAMNHS